MSEILWTPTRERAEKSQMWAFAREASRRTGLDLSDYSALHQWSVDSPESFWELVWEVCEVIGDRSERRGTSRAGAQAGVEFSEARFLPEARLNFAENLLRRRGPETAVVFIGESGERRELSFDALREQVARVAGWLRSRGIGVGDRVAACLPNLPETIVAMLATTSLGGIWSSCSPDFGSDGVVDRFSQIEPKLFLCTDAYFYNGKRVETLDRVPAILAALPTVEYCVVVPYAGSEAGSDADLSSILGRTAADEG